VAWRRVGEPPVLFDLPPGTYEAPRASPDGRHVSYTTAGPDLSELWIYDIERQAALRRLKRIDILTPIWSPASDRIYFGSGLSGDPVLFELEVEGARPPRVVYEGEAGGFVTPTTMTPDGKTVLVVVDDKQGQMDIIGVDTESGEWSVVLASPLREAQPELDPSGKWMAFMRDQAGEMQIYLTSLEPGGPMLQVSQSPSRSPRWARDGRSIYFLPFGVRELWTVDVELGDRPTLGTPRLYLEDFYWDYGKQFPYDVAPDGRILTFVDIGGSELGRELRVQSTWLEAAEGAGELTR
jgi:Tol biopolymer transport system component